MKKLKFVGILFGLAGIGMIVGGSVVLFMAKAGATSLQAVYEAQNVMMSYDDNGNFIDRGEVAGGDAILGLLVGEWKYPLNRRNLNPNDPLVNTPDELMVQYARISHHVMHGTQTVVLEEDVEYKGELFEAGEYEFDIDGRTWQAFDRMHPIEGPARGLAWTGTAHALLANLAAATATATLVQFVMFFGIFLIGLGITFLLGGLGLVKASKPEDEIKMETEQN
jgi:hypothetical protein